MDGRIGVRVCVLADRFRDHGRRFRVHGRIIAHAGRRAAGKEISRPSSLVPLAARFRRALFLGVPLRRSGCIALASLSP
jgi:hypothetical protein